MMKAIGMMLLLVGASGLALADITVVPEISTGSAVNALALLTGIVFVVRGRSKGKT